MVEERWSGFASQSGSLRSPLFPRPPALDFVEPSVVAPHGRAEVFPGPCLLAKTRD